MSREESDGLLGHVIDPRAGMPPWLAPSAARLLARRSTMPHALLISGAACASLEHLAEVLAAGLLCDEPDAGGYACGGCTACLLLAAGNHPDLLWLRPDEADESTGRKASLQIRIEGVRRLIATLTLRPHHGSMRVSVIDPAEAMNPAAANALLKVLEEPPPGNVLLLISERPMRLLPTLRSRCIERRVAPGRQAQPGAGVQGPAGKDGASPDEELVAFLRDPSPNAAARELWPVQRALLEVLAGGARARMASISRITPLTLPAVLGVLSRWVHDLARVKAGGEPRFLPERRGLLAKLALEADLQGVLQMSRRLAEWQRHAHHPLHGPLTVADILLEYRAEVFPRDRGGRPPAAVAGPQTPRAASGCPGGSMHRGTTA
jgi:DNA polymerase-3 subunit delta'